MSVNFALTGITSAVPHGIYIATFVNGIQSDAICEIKSVRLNGSKWMFTSAWEMLTFRISFRN